VEEATVRVYGYEGVVVPIAIDDDVAEYPTPMCDDQASYDPSLLLNVFQSVLVRHPKIEPEAVAHVRALLELDSPLPVRLLKDEPLTMRLVVEAVAKDE
jgi:hypothetical protein